MSRIGKMPISVPKGVEVRIAGQEVTVKGPKGQLVRAVRPEIEVTSVDGELVLSRRDTAQATRAYHGLERSLLNNMVEGVAQGFVKELELIGVGYKADVKGNTLTLGLGYSHDINYELPKGVVASVIKEGRQIFVRLEGIDKQIIGQVAAVIRSFRKPEPYKGKGVRYRNEVVRRKAGKAGKK
ncbi:MAG: 50S ribosomal protein L6 [bacterium]|nr:50S ribosomal protein L6 [bacterium]